MNGILFDLGGVLIDNDWRAAARSWGARPGVPEPLCLATLFEGSDDQVLVGRASEQAWCDTAGHVDAAAALGMLGYVHRDPGSTAAAIASFVATGDEAHRPSNAGGA